MNKKDISFILVGIALISLELNIKLGGITIDIFNDIIGYVLILIGLIPLAGRNSQFKKSRKTAITGILISCAVQFFYFFDFGEHTALAYTFCKAFTTIFFIYLTFYFSESIILESKMQMKAAVTRTLRITWSILGFMAFAYYIAVMSDLSLVVLLAQALSTICSLYYIYVVYNCCHHLYMEGMPPITSEIEAQKQEY